MSFTLYRMRARRGELLYVGQSMRLPERVKQHRSDKVWWEEIDAIELQHFREQKALNEAERRAIILERPRHNRMWSCSDFAPVVLPRRHATLTQPEIKRSDMPRILGTDERTISKAVRADILTGTRGHVRSAAAVQMWVAVAPLGLMCQQITTLMSGECGTDMTGRARAMCWLIGDLVAQDSSAVDTMNEHLRVAGLPRYPWAMSRGNIR